MAVRDALTLLKPSPPSFSNFVQIRPTAQSMFSSMCGGFPRVSRLDAGWADTRQQPFGEVTPQRNFESLFVPQGQ